MSSSSRFGEQTDPCTLVLPASGSEVDGHYGACLVVIRGDRLGAKVDLDGSAVVIGRGTDADFQIASRSVSRSHCRIVGRDGGFWVEDLRSTNHTFVNDEQIDESKLTDGDQLRVGKSVLKFLDAGNLEAGYLAEMREQTVRDELTGLYNRRHLMSLLGDEVERCRRRDDIKLALAIIDVDLFKDINDMIGHLAGDAVLKQLATVINEQVRGDDTLARIGGEEFAVVMPETSHKHALEVCERLRSAVAGHRFVLEGEKDLKVTISIGLATWDSEMGSLSDLMRVADKYLYEAKSGGRNRVRSAAAED
jgi:two-component system, cell cycle response regulator